MKFATINSSCILQQLINQHCKTTYPFYLNELLKINTTFFFFLPRLLKSNAWALSSWLGKRRLLLFFTIRAVPGDFASELANSPDFQEHCHTKQLVLRLPTCVLPWGAACSELNPERST